MGLFRKKEKKEETETNQINNKELKENLANAALSILVQTQEITPDDFAGITAKFGYLLVIENHGLEALFKIIKNDVTYYFAAQKGELMMLTINEMQYETTVAHMLDMHT